MNQYKPVSTVLGDPKKEWLHYVAGERIGRPKYDFDWIPVGEKLPDEDVKVLVCCKTKKGVRSVNMAYLLNGFWHGQGSMAGVTHWMPLPELPEEVEHE